MEEGRECLRVAGGLGLLTGSERRCSGEDRSGVASTVKEP